MRFILTGRRKRSDLDQGLYAVSCVVYVGKSGCTTYHGEKAYVYRTLESAEDERAYWNTVGAPNYVWSIEQLPACIPISQAVLRAKEVSR